MIEADELVTFSGFVEAFWGEYKRCADAGYAYTQEDIYNRLNDIYFRKFGQNRFPSFDAFRKKRNRILKK